ncbi:MAG: heparinase II/III family protein [Armatimonadia bacterium]
MEQLLGSLRRFVIIFTCGVTLLACLGAQAADLAQLPGVVAIADSQHRDRWGLDGWHPWLAFDGRLDTAWLSDDWEVTHSLVLIFPKQVKPAQVVISWGGPQAPQKLVVLGWSEGKWVELKATEPGLEPTTTVDLPATPVSALCVRQPAGSANTATSNRLQVNEVQVNGEPTGAAVDTGALKQTLAQDLRKLRLAEDEQRVAPQLAVVMSKPKTSGFMGIIDRQDLALGRKNLATRQWAKSYAGMIIRDADWWVGQADDYIYSLIPEGNPRALCPSFEHGCPIHGGARGSYTATLEQPNRWKCKQGDEEWYDGAVVKNPGTGENVTVHDDGSGWLAPAGFPKAGRRYYFVAAYRYFLLGKLFSGPYEGDGGSKYKGGTPVMMLAEAYAFTGDAKYAHKCAVMLNRLAELYRFYDGGLEGPSQRQDGYIGNTFERFLVQNIILACDLIWDEVPKDAALRDFFAAKGDADYNADGKCDGNDLTYNLQRNLLGYIYEYLHRCMPYFDGDFIMYEMTALSGLASCLGNDKIAREMLESDVGLRVMLTNSWFRDGKFIYDSTGYNLGNAQTPLAIAEWIHGYPYEGKPLDLYNDPDYRMSALFDFIRYIDCDGRVPQIGDVGGSRSQNLREGVAYGLNDERALLRLPAQRGYYQSKIMAAGGGDMEAARAESGDCWRVFHIQPAPPAKPADAKLPPSRSYMFDDGGIAILRAGDKAATRQHVAMTFSKGQYGHGHPDKLAINIFRYGWDFSADLGYPTTWTDRKAGGWEMNTASHCTVMVDEAGQAWNVIGDLHYYATSPSCDVVEASAEDAYPQCSLYRRTVALVRDDAGEPLYTFDLFRVAGGKTRDYLFHSFGKPEDMAVTIEGQQPPWVKQARGSLAGEDVEPTTKAGYGWLWDVQRAPGEGLVKAVWSPKSGGSQGDRYLLTKQSFTNCTVEFNITRVGQAGGPQERCVFVFATDPQQVNNRRVIMMPAGSLPIGKPVAVKVQVREDQATMTVDGKATGSVDVAGAPAKSGSVGLLHYYNYAYDYSDFTITPEGGAPIRADFTKPLDEKFWARNDGTYSVADGVLKARDTEPVMLTLHMLGQPGREVIRAVSEGYGVRGQAPLEGHLIVRDRPADSRQVSAFVSIIEAHREPSRVRAVRALPVTTEEDDPIKPGELTAVLVETVNAAGAVRQDILISSASQEDWRGRHLKVGDRDVYFEGRFALLTLKQGKPIAAMLVGGGELASEAGRLELPGTYHGTVTAANAEKSAVAVKTAEGSLDPTSSFVGNKLLVRNKAYGYTSVYTIEKAERLAGGSCRFVLNMPLIVARGVVAESGTAGSFASQTPVMKLRVNAGLFDGKPVRKSPSGREWRLKSATEAAFTPLDAKALQDFPAGGAYVVCDVGIGDEIEIIPSGYARY